MDTPQENFPEPRYLEVSRRAFLRRSALVGLAAAAVPVLAACGGSSSGAPASNAPGTTGAGTTPTAATIDSGTVPGTASVPGATTTIATDSGASTTAPGAAGATFPAGGQLVIDFTFEVAGGGRVDSPFIAVWIEDPAGDLVQTVSLWYKSDESKYLRELTRWNSKNNQTALTTGATRIPGAFSVAWNGTDLDGKLVPDGDYFVCIEAAREHGPYQIIRESVPVSASLAPTTLTPSGELVAASVQVVA